MDPLALTAEALREPWRLWTCHVLHHGWGHLLANGVAIAVPLLLARRGSLRSLLPLLVLAAPLLPLLDGGAYRGASGLACTLWALVGLDLATRRESAGVGLLMLGGLVVKLAAESALGSPLGGPAAGWQPLPAAHGWGALLGLLGHLAISLRPPSLRAAPRR